MVNNFPVVKVSTERHFHHKAVFWQVSVRRVRLRMERRPDHRVAVSMQSTAVDPFRMTLTRSRPCARSLQTQDGRSTLNGRAMNVERCRDGLVSLSSGQQLAQARLVHLQWSILGKANPSTFAKGVQQRSAQTEVARDVFLTLTAFFPGENFWQQYRTR